MRSVRLVPSVKSRSASTSLRLTTSNRRHKVQYSFDKGASMPQLQSPINPMRSIEGLDRKRAHVTNPRHLRMIDVLQEHVVAELDGDLERIMKTLVPEPSYH